MTTEIWEELRADGRLAIDQPGQKLAVYPNGLGDVVLLHQEPGEPLCHTTIHPDDVVRVCSLLMGTVVDAREVGQELDAEYEAYKALMRAQGKAI